jgi:hypothetical protein
LERVEDLETGQTASSSSSGVYTSGDFEDMVGKDKRGYSGSAQCGGYDDKDVIL